MKQWILGKAGKAFSVLERAASYIKAWEKESRKHKGTNAESTGQASSLSLVLHNTGAPLTRAFGFSAIHKLCCTPEGQMHRSNRMSVMGKLRPAYKIGVCLLPRLFMPLVRILGKILICHAHIELNARAPQPTSGRGIMKLQQKNEK